MSSEELADELMPTDEFGPDEASWLDIFGRLSSCRQLGMSVGPIPWTAINDYCLHQGLAEQDTLVTEIIIRHLDGVYLEFIAKQVEEERERAKAPKPRKR